MWAHLSSMSWVSRRASLKIVDDIYTKFPTLKLNELADFESLKKMWRVVVAYGEILTPQKMAEMVEQVENTEKPKKK
jgi:hypothetical protein